MDRFQGVISYDDYTTLGRGGLIHSGALALPPSCDACGDNSDVDGVSYEPTENC